MEECKEVVNSEGFLVDTCTGEVVEDFRFTYERYDNLVPIVTTKVDNTDEKKYRQYMRIMKHRAHELNLMINELMKRIEDEKIREDFARLAEEAKRYGRAGIVVAFALAHYLNGVSIRTKKLRMEFDVGDYEYREVRKLLQMKVGKKDIHGLVLEKLREIGGNNFEELKQRYFQLLREGKLSGKNVKTRIEIVLGKRKV